MIKYISDWERCLTSDVEEAELLRRRRHTRTGRPFGGDALIRRLEERLRQIPRKRKPGLKGARQRN